MAHHDGNGWIVCAHGHRHWGLNGAAGLLLRDRTGPTPRVLMQHRAPWTSDGDTWGLPGGARDSHESAQDAALREATEEAGIVPADVRVVSQYVDDHGGWSYVTVIAEVARPIVLVPNEESLALEWVDERSVDELNLHGGFAKSWSSLREV